jgi:hypothetical protein
MKFVCVYCGKVRDSHNGTGSDIACCGEVGHVELTATNEEPMSNQIINAPGGAVALPGDLIHRLAQYAQQTQQTEVSQGSFFSTRAGVLSFNKMPVPGNQMDVVILRSMFENVYYPEKFSGDKMQSPLCFAFSHDGRNMAPHADATAPQSDVCTSCPYSQWNSGDNGKGKACKEQRRLACLPASALKSPDEVASGIVGYLRVPVTSVKLWTAYAQKIAAGGMPPFAVVTRIKVVPDPKSQFRIEFEPVRSVAEPEILEALFARHDAEAALIAFPYSKRESAPVPPAPGSAPAGSSKF